jgi:hypothetical protein
MRTFIWSLLVGYMSFSTTFSVLEARDGFPLETAFLESCLR